MREHREVGALLVELIARELPRQRGVGDQRLDRRDDRRASTDGDPGEGRVGRQRARQEATGEGVEVVVTGEACQRRIGADQRSEEQVGVATGRKVVCHGQFFARCVTADQPVEMAVEGRALQAQFLRNRAELVVGGAIVGPVQHVESLIVGVLPASEFVVAVSRDRSQLGTAEVLDDFGRNAAVIDVRTIAASRSDRNATSERVVLDLRAKPVEQALEG